MKIVSLDLDLDLDHDRAPTMFAESAHLTALGLILSSHGRCVIAVIILLIRARSDRLRLLPLLQHERESTPGLSRIDDYVKHRERGCGVVGDRYLIIDSVQSTVQVSPLACTDADSQTRRLADSQSRRSGKSRISRIRISRWAEPSLALALALALLPSTRSQSYFI